MSYITLPKQVMSKTYITANLRVRPTGASTSSSDMVISNRWLAYSEAHWQAGGMLEIARRLRAG